MKPAPEHAWLPGSTPTHVIRFELTEELTGDSAQARLLVYDETTEQLEYAGDPFDVYNPLGMFYGIEGDRGYAVWMGVPGRYEILQKACVPE